MTRRISYTNDLTVPVTEGIDDPRQRTRRTRDGVRQLLSEFGGEQGFDGVSTAERSGRRTVSVPIAEHRTWDLDRDPLGEFAVGRSAQHHHLGR